MNLTNSSQRLDTFFNILLLIAGISQAFAENEVVSSSSTPVPPNPLSSIYKAPEQLPMSNIPNQTYPYLDGYRGYDGYNETSLVKQPIQKEQPSGYISSVIPATQDNKIHGKKRTNSLELSAEEPSEEFIMTKLLDIRLKGGYDYSRKELRDVIRSQFQSNPGFNQDRHSSRVQDESCPDVCVENKKINNCDFLLEKLENITVMQSSQNAEFIADCNSLVGVDKTSRCNQIVNKKHTLPKSCKEIQLNGQNVSGMYEIQPKLSKKPLMVLCDMDIMGGGWAHIQRRIDGSQDFSFGWREYKFGFGNLNGEFWLGLENIYMSTASEVSELLVEIVDRDNVKAHAHYKAFAIGSEVEGYPLSVLKEYSGDAGDSLIIHLGEKFSTKDFDRDSNPGNCAVSYSSGWWFKSCHKNNLNGKYLNTVLPDQYAYQGLHWNTFRSHEYGHARARMLIRPA